MSKEIKQHLLGLLKEKESFLLGLSGGPDSLALFYLLLECQKDLPFTFGVAHVDHGWREESQREAEELHGLCAQYSVPFHLKTLAIDPESKNLEAKCREERLSFFNRLCENHGYQAVMLGHQLDDQAETVLKNLFEGSSLSSCYGISEESRIGSLEIWRPLLKFPKEALIHWLNEQGHSYFVDRTNCDERFLRARMRETMIPYLEARFGKNIRRSLALLSQESQELNQYLQMQLTPLLSRIRKGGLGSYLSLSGELTPFEAKFLIRQLCRKEGCTPSREIVEQGAFHLLKGASNKRFFVGDKMLYVDRRCLFVTHAPKEEMPTHQVQLVNGVEYGRWKLEVEELRLKDEMPPTNWEDLWRGCGELFLPKREASYFLGRAPVDRKWWNQHKVPTFLRHLVPVIWSDQTIFHEFLTGKKERWTLKNDCWLKISLILIKR